jgi:hypothetical protein
VCARCYFGLVHFAPDDVDADAYALPYLCYHVYADHYTYTDGDPDCWPIANADACVYAHAVSDAVYVS